MIRRQRSEGEQQKRTGGGVQTARGSAAEISAIPDAIFGEGMRLAHSRCSTADIGTPWRPSDLSTEMPPTVRPGIAGGVRVAARSAASGSRACDQAGNLFINLV